MEKKIRQLDVVTNTFWTKKFKTAFCWRGTVLTGVYTTTAALTLLAEMLQEILSRAKGLPLYLTSYKPSISATYNRRVKTPPKILTSLQISQPVGMRSKWKPAVWKSSGLWRSHCHGRSKVVWLSMLTSMQTFPFCLLTTVISQPKMTEDINTKPTICTIVDNIW